MGFFTHDKESKQVLEMTEEVKIENTTNGEIEMDTTIDIKKKIAKLETIIKGHHKTIKDYRRDLIIAEQADEIAKLKAGR